MMMMMRNAERRRRSKGRRDEFLVGGVVVVARQAQAAGVDVIAVTRSHDHDAAHACDCLATMIIIIIMMICMHTHGPTHRMLPPLALHPNGQGLVGRVRRRDVAMPVLCLEFAQMRESFLPRAAMTVPAEAQIVQHLLAFIGQRGVATGLADLVLAALPFDPMREPRTLVVIQRHQAIPMACRVLFQSLVLFHPLLRVQSAETLRPVLVASSALFVVAAARCRGR
mmetsp:Transcript_28381/g.79811  ORF Transcript_28381/g.79811 Transcript_28381/m.79811 type:complete len:225 (+) Transcript_28381:367-1041(+)